jgi:hypothetical protein
MGPCTREINRFERAVRAHEMSGAAHPNDRPAIEQEYHRAKEALERAILRAAKASWNHRSPGRSE